MPVPNRENLKAVTIPNSEKELFDARVNELRAWRAQNDEVVENSWRVSGDTVVVHARWDSVTSLPSYVVSKNYFPKKRLGLFADVKDINYDYKGTLINGTKHFAVGTAVYVFRQSSGDGWERANMVGLQRDTGMIIKIKGPLDRFENWRVECVENPAYVWVLENLCKYDAWIKEERPEMEAAAEMLNRRVASVAKL